MVNRNASMFIAMAVLAGCGADPTGGPTGGVDVPHDGACPAALVVGLSDWMSTQIAVTKLDGITLSESLISTASTTASGVSYALSGDVALPSAAPPSGRVVLLDRFGTNVVTWVDPKSAGVVSQLPVGAGFESNPQDYIEIDGALAFISRWGQNASPGNEEHDEGGDVLIVDTQEPRIVGRIAMPSDDGLPPRPAGMARVGDEVVVILQRIALDFASAGDSVLAGISVASRSVAWTHTFVGLKGCGAPSLAPSGDRLAVACLGKLDADGNVADIAASALVLLDVTASPPVEIKRFPAAAIAGEAIQADAELVTDDLVLLKTQSPLGGASNNRVLALDLASGAATPLLEASPGGDGEGKGVVYGTLWCSPGCSDVCVMADSDAGVLQRFRVEGGAASTMQPLRVEETIGLPPRLVSAF